MVGLQAAIPARFRGFMFIVQVDATATIRDLKVVIKRSLGERFKTLDVDGFLLFAAKKEGNPLAARSKEVHELLKTGETRHLQKILMRDLELDADALVDDVFKTPLNEQLDFV
ncbi:hypothetical protein GN244_ATG08271 [Phytophthora infestans]|uniref:Crinkler effector protein N-terminal domain-containing protein n=1 Tax=Phytophthora infestans TaxID=4787 RepID=A0A833WKH7_PHYIN|nr:hypothetical protein GN244_ATG08271 [Phytophthora infestans]